MMMKSVSRTAEFITDVHLLLNGTRRNWNKHHRAMMLAHTDRHTDIHRDRQTDRHSGRGEPVHVSYESQTTE